MKYPYGVMADLHAHNWQAFSSYDAEGRNNRLMHIVHEMNRCAEKIRGMGGNEIIIAGDVFHTRGSVSPTVFNPIKDCLTKTNKDVRWKILNGNHDLESEESLALSSAVQMLESDNVTVWNERTMEDFVVAIPWRPNYEELLSEIQAAATTLGVWCDRTDLFLHAGFDGVIPNLKGKHLDPAEIAKLGFKRVFAGHYHAHKDLGGGVWSIGAPCHHTWGDIGTKAGWLIVDNDDVQFFASHAPKFIELKGSEDDAEIPLIVDGHYVRTKIGAATPGEIVGVKKTLKAAGALGVQVISTPTTAGRTSGVSVRLDNIHAAVKSFGEAQGFSANAVQRAQTILQELER